MISTIKGIIFDLDGTIANTLPLCIAAFRKAVEPLTGKALTDEEIIATFGPSEEGTIMALAPAHYDRGVAGYLQHYEDMHHMCAGPFDGIVELLASLKAKGVKIAMVTGKGKYSTEISLNNSVYRLTLKLLKQVRPKGHERCRAYRWY